MPRKTHHRRLLVFGELVASMRPRPDAAENAGANGVPAWARGASMRPRPDAAENQGAEKREPGGGGMLQ